MDKKTNNWQIKKLGEVCKTTSGGTPSRKNKNYIKKQKNEKQKNSGKKKKKKMDLHLKVIITLIMEFLLLEFRI